MSIQDLRIRGFRSLRNVAWKPGRLNVLIGPNGSGKSNLLRALELLQRSAEGKLPQDILRQGGIGALLWDRRLRDIDWHLEIEDRGERLTYDLIVLQMGETSAYRVEDEALSQDGLQLFRRRRGTIETLDAARVPTQLAVLPPDEATLLPLLGSPLGTPEISRFRGLLESWSIYHDLRVDSAAPLRQAAVARLEKRVAPDGQNLIPVLHTLYTGDREFKRTVDAALRAAFGPDYEELTFPPAADQRVQLRLRWRSLRTEQSAADLSDGTIRFLLLLATLASPEPGALIAIDEPETGLHPSMFPIIAELAAEAAERTQVILTTHSPQFLDAFTEQPPTTTVVQWEEGETRLSVIDGDELRRWLREYSLGSLFRSGELEGMA